MASSAIQMLVKVDQDRNGLLERSSEIHKAQFGIGLGSKNGTNSVNPTIEGVF